MAKRKAPMGPAEGGAAGGAGAATTSTAGAELSVSNLPVTYGEDDVRALFSRCGEVRAVHMAIDQLSGSPSGVATVVLGSSASASNAQQLLHKASADGEGGKLLNVWKAANSAEPDATEDRTALYMRGVPPAWGDAELRTFLSQHGALEGVKKLPQRNPDPNLVPAIGRFATRECAERTLQAINGTSLQNESDSGPESTVLQVRFADSQNAKRHKQSAVRRDDAHFGAVAAPATAVPPLLAQQQQQQQAQQFPNVVGGFTNTAQPPPPNSRAPNQAPSAASNGYMASSTSAPPAPPAPAANAPPPPTAPQGNGAALARTPSSSEMPTRLHVRNLPSDAGELYVYRLFAPHGAITHAKVISDQTTGECKGYGFVTFRRYGEALQAIQAVDNQTASNGKHIHVEFAHGGRQNRSV